MHATWSTTRPFFDAASKHASPTKIASTSKPCNSTRRAAKLIKKVMALGSLGLGLLRKCYCLRCHTINLCQGDSHPRTYACCHLKFQKRYICTSESNADPRLTSSFYRSQITSPSITVTKHLAILSLGVCACACDQAVAKIKR